MSRERAAAWSLAVVATPDAAMLDTRVSLSAREMTVGREPGPGPVIAVRDPEMSKRHLRLLVSEEGALSVVDLHSTNGTFVGGRRCPPVEAVPAGGAPVRAGATVLVPASSGPGAFDPAAPPVERHPELAPAMARRLLATRPDAGPLTAEAVEALVLHPWEGGADELVRVIASVAENLRPLEAVDATHLRQVGLRVVSERAGRRDTPASRTPDEAAVRALLAEQDGSVRACSAALGVARKQLYRWLKRYDIDPEEYRR